MALLEDKSMMGFIILVLLICGLIGYIIHLLNNQINISNELNGIINKLDTDVNQEIKIIEDKVTNINDKIKDNNIPEESLEDIKKNINSMKDKISKATSNEISESNVRECPECICNNQTIDEKALHDKIQANKVTCPNLEEIVRAVFPGRGTPGFTVYGEYVPIDENSEYYLSFWSMIFGSGVGGALAIAGGTILGGLIGGEIAERLSEDEQMEFGQVTEDALENKDMGETSNWTSSLSADTTGEVSVTQSFELKQKPCKKIKQKLDKDGQTFVKIKSFCRDENDNWVEVTE